MCFFPLPLGGTFLLASLYCRSIVTYEPVCPDLRGDTSDRWSGVRNPPGRGNCGLSSNRRWLSARGDPFLNNCEEGLAGPSLHRDEEEIACLPVDPAEHPLQANHSPHVAYAASELALAYLDGLSFITSRQKLAQAKLLNSDPMNRHVNPSRTKQGFEVEVSANLFNVYAYYSCVFTIFHSHLTPQFPWYLSCSPLLSGPRLLLMEGFRYM